ncbi:hypothetical protein HMPREF1207_05618 [Paenibacillus sp. HGH0039]|nr:hypothetical protein HMPREF1207_05618 [Paenibacillus sp. HGH0039]
MTKKRRWSPEKRARLSERGQTENLKLGTLAAQVNPKTGPFETNEQALIWVLKSPEGIVHEFRNLSHWTRQHADILPGTPEQARCGIMQIKRSMLGKTRRPVTSWKGWTLLGWRKPDNGESGS